MDNHKITAPKEFFNNGLRFQCQPDCGACCSQKGEVFVNGTEIHRLATFLRMPVAQFRKRYLRRVHGRHSLIDSAFGGCIFLEENKQCAVHPARPDQCRAYPFWPEVLVDELAWEWEKIKCPGIDNGEIIPASEIKIMRDSLET